MSNGVKIIEDTQSLVSFCENLEFEGDLKLLSIDTEFLSDLTYESKLCLIQIADDKKAVLIDPLSPGIKLDSLWALLQRSDVYKVLHDARNDLDLFYSKTGQLPTPIYDTQVAAQYCGYGRKMGLKFLIEEILEKKLDKSEQRSDWSMRPLTEGQKKYALEDVISLNTIYKHLHKKLNDMGRQTWQNEELAALCDEETYNRNPENAWIRHFKRDLELKFLNPNSLEALKKLAAFREITAKRYNLPYGKVMSNKQLKSVAEFLPKNLFELKKSGIPYLDDPEHVHSILQILDVCRKLSNADHVNHVKVQKDDELIALNMLCNLLVKKCAEDVNLPHNVIATTEELKSYIMDKNSPFPFLNGWRFKIFGKKLLDLLDGRLAITAKDGKIQLHQIS